MGIKNIRSSTPWDIFISGIKLKFRTIFALGLDSLPLKCFLKNPYFLKTVMECSVLVTNPRS